jgi:hypothetical protein
VITHVSVIQIQNTLQPAGCRPATVPCKMKCKLLAAVDQEIRIAAVTELEHLGCSAHAESLQQTL